MATVDCGYARSLGRSRAALRAVVRTVLILATAAAHAGAAPSVPDADTTPANPIDYSRTVVLFYGERCPHCHEAINYLESVVGEYPLITFVRIEVGQTTNFANRAYFGRVMSRLDSEARGYPRLVVGDRVFAGFTESDGPLQWMESHQAYAGFRNQIAEALEGLHAKVARTEGGGRRGSTTPPVVEETDLTIEPIRSSAERASARGVPWAAGGLRWGVGLRSIIVAAVLVLYAIIAAVIHRRRGNASKQRRRLWIGGGVLLAVLGLFAVLTGTSEGAIAEAVGQLPFPLFVTAIALLDGFNPCAFTVLFILLSLLTYAQRRGHMIAVGGIFVAASAAVYVAFIFAIITIGSFALANVGTWVLRAIGGVVVLLGALGIYEILRPASASPVTSLSAADKAGLSRRAAAVVRRFTEAQTPAARVAALGATAVLAVVVNSVELGCTAILPAVYMSSLISSFGPQIGVAHVLWTLWYGAIYVLPMAAILVNFVITFRSDRMSITQGRHLKLAGSTVMILLGGILAVAPQILTF
jgi:thiol-disulfide isomerase/thioredoxin